MSFKGYKAEYGSKPVEKKNFGLELDEPVTRSPTSDWKGNEFVLFLHFHP